MNMQASQEGRFQQVNLSSGKVEQLQKLTESPNKVKKNFVGYREIVAASVSYEQSRTIGMEIMREQAMIIDYARRFSHQLCCIL